MNESTIAGPAYLRRGRAGEHEDAGADDGADAEQVEVERAERRRSVASCVSPLASAWSRAMLFLDHRPMGFSGGWDVGKIRSTARFVKNA